ncbi:MAG: NUDIX hydrolase [Trichlorobacter sp.]|jgi:8-oxo-dGTP diphosphatase
MSFDSLTCPACGTLVRRYRNPIPTVDIVIEVAGGIVLIERKNPPFGWALPGGFVEYGESLEQAASREAREETALIIRNLQLLGCYSDPVRDSRMHTISTVFVAQASGTPQAASDALNVRVFRPDQLPEKLCFDHGRMLQDYLIWKALRY